MSQVNKKNFEVKLDGEDKPATKLSVIRPNHRVTQHGQLVYSKAYIEACRAGVAVQDAMLKAIRDQKLWDEQKQVRLEAILKNLLDGEKKLAQGGNAGLTKKAARDLSIQMRMDRFELQSLTSERNKYLTNTAEAFAEQAKFNYYVAACTVYSDTGKPYFKDTEDYLSRDNDDKVAGEAAKLMSTIAYPLDENFERNQPENKYLLKYGYCNEKLHLIDPVTKHLVNIEGKPVNELGQLVNANDEPIDVDGTPLTETGEYKVEFAEFLDEAPAKPTTDTPAEQPA